MITGIHDIGILSDFAIFLQRLDNGPYHIVNTHQRSQSVLVELYHTSLRLIAQHRVVTDWRMMIRTHLVEVGRLVQLQRFVLICIPRSRRSRCMRRIRSHPHNKRLCRVWILRLIQHSLVNEIHRGIAHHGGLIDILVQSMVHCIRRAVDVAVVILCAVKVLVIARQVNTIKAIHACRCGAPITTHLIHHFAKCSSDIAVAVEFLK
mmetsp:Transcript_71880/g.114466  ORF Transcript_71880/g.114466 Transcript_71880/m.114466 type:complete len:206 (+) Transcript_71880:867-1484(+)